MASIRRTDILALSGLRNDGRKPNEIRRMHIEMDDNSAVVSMGLSTAAARVTGPIDCQRRSDERPDRAIVEVSIQVLSFATADRRTSSSATDRRVVEATHLIQKALEATILVHTYPKTRIVVDISVLADDGGRLVVATNAATLALLEAGIPMKDFVCACAAGFAGGSDTTSEPLVDLNRKEEVSGSAVIPCAILPQRGTVVMTLCEAHLQDYDEYQRLMDAATDGCRAVFDNMQAAVKERAAAVLSASAGHARIKLAS